MKKTKLPPPPGNKNGGGAPAAGNPLYMLRDKANPALEPVCLAMTRAMADVRNFTLRLAGRSERWSLFGGRYDHHSVSSARRPNNTEKTKL